MNTSLDLFNTWAKRSDTPIISMTEKRAVVYTRVSSKEQFDKNLSLDWQKNIIQEFSGRNGFQVLEYFGGTFESAKTDGRKEFVRMLEFIKKKGGVSHILVYLLDRFSRTGGGAIKLAKELREKYGVTIVAVTQPIDTSNPGGVFQQSMQFLFSEYDNQLRRQRAMAGIKEKLNRGIWCIKPPMGYDIVRTEGNRKIVVNATGKKLKKAFEWKAQGMKNEDILDRLQAMGMKIYKQKLSMIFSNPFYCGIISNKMLEGRLVEGIHEKMISHDLFLQVNQIRQAAGGKYGATHKKEIDAVPLKVFVKCSKCGKPYTGFIVKAKGIYYYKCRTTGCRCNRNAQKLNELFVQHLLTYTLKASFLAPLVDEMNHLFDRHGDAVNDQESDIRQNLTEVEKKLDNIEEDFYIKRTMPQETYEKFRKRLFEEKKEIEHSLTNMAESSSNLKSYFSTAMEVALELATAWTLNKVAAKENLQKLVFPEGILYDHKNGAFQTIKVNEVFERIAVVNCIPEDDKNKQGSISAALSCLVGMTGFEPAASSSRTKRATGLRYIPKMFCRRAGCKNKTLR